MDGLKTACGLLVLFLTAGCASLPVDRGREGTAAGDETAARQMLAQLSSKPLSADTAVQLALVNNPRLKAEYAKLGFAAADVYDAGRLSNPRLSASVLIPDVSGAANQVGFGLVQSFTNLLMLSSRSRFAEGEFERVKQIVGAQVLNLAADTEAAYYRLTGAWQMVTMREAVATAAQSSADLAQRFFDAGNIKRLELALEQAAASQAQLDVLQARADLTGARSALNRLMGLSASEDNWKVSGQLPAPLMQEDAIPELLKTADASRLDLAAARKRVSLLADAQGVTRRFRYLGEIDVGVETQRETDRSRITGPTLALELPIFNQGRGRMARAEAGMQQAEAELRSLEIEISNGVQRAAAEVAAAKSRADQYRLSLIPLRESIVARTQEEVNFMLVGQFELLLAKQQEYDAYQGYLEAVRDYWLARVELGREVGTRLPSSAQATPDVLDADELIRPKGGGMQMEGMDMPMDNSGDEMKDMQHDMPGMDKSGEEMKGMQHDMQQMDKSGGELKQMDHPGHGTSKKKAVPKKDAAPSMPPPRKSEGHSDMPTGMESHIPEPAGKSKPAPKKSNEVETQPHGDHK
ncbi:MAG: TolC family protein [Pseudomonadota bacterium]